MHSRGGSYWVLDLVWCWSVSTLARDLDVHNCDRCKYGALTNSDITLVKVWYIMVSIHFIDTLHTTFFNHWKSATWTLLGRLEEKSYHLVWWNLVTISTEDLCERHNCSHVSIMSAHMCMICLCLIIQIWIVLWHWKSIHIGSECHTVYSVLILLPFFLRFTFTFKVNNESSLGDILDLTFFHANFEHYFFKSCSGLKFFETTLSILMDLSSEINHFLCFQTIIFHYFSMFSVVWLEIGLRFSCLFSLWCIILW